VLPDEAIHYIISDHWIRQDNSSKRLCAHNREGERERSRVVEAMKGRGV
jgi:hypothetical protein